MSRFSWRWAAAPLALALCGPAAAETQIALSLAGEACDGAPAFQLSTGGKVLAEGVVTKAIDTGSEGRLYGNPSPDAFVQSFVYSIDDADLPPDAAVRLVLTNDRWVPSAGCDRNLFVVSVTVNGEARKGADLHLLQGEEPQPAIFQAGMLPLYSAGQAAVAGPPAGGWPGPSHQADAAAAEPVRKTAATNAE